MQKFVIAALVIAVGTLAGTIGVRKYDEWAASAALKKGKSK